ncbi:MAG: GAF domain-containing protein [Terracidiphilus sp.]|nr:GAF domain-containing protein [Terracidiphilus sp.]
MTTPLHDELLSAIESFAATASSAESLERFIAETLATRLPNYNWVGFYMLATDDETMLELGPYVGAPTIHTRIPVSEGICGAAVAQAATIVVDDVHSDPRYLACSIETQSEIVAPIRVRGRIVGEIDIDSHRKAAFPSEDRAFVERCAEIVGNYLERTSKV